MRDLPPLLGAPRFHRHAVRLQQVLGRVVIAMRVLNAFEDGELAPWPHVDFELPDAVDDVVVDALGVLAVGLAAGLPVAFEDVLGVG